MSKVRYTWAWPEMGRVVGGDPARVHGDQWPGLERDDLPAGRVVEPHPRPHRSPAVAVAGQLHGRMHLVADVDGDEHRGERLDGRGLGQAPGIDPRSPSMHSTAPPSPTTPPRGRSRPARRPPSARSASPSPRPADGGRRPTPWSWAGRPGSRRPPSPRRQEGHELPALLDQGIGHRHDHVAGQGRLQWLDRGDGAVPGVATTTRSHDALRLVGRTPDGQGVVGPRVDEARGDVLGPLRVPRPDDHFLTGCRQADRQSPPGGSGSSENSDSHRPTLAQTPRRAESLVDDNLTR